MRTDIVMAIVYATCMVGSALATGHGALVLTHPTTGIELDAGANAGHLADDPLIQGKIIAALARLDAGSIDELEARNVVSSTGEEIGDIDSVSVSRESGELYAVIALNGISIANMKEVAVPLRQVLPKGRFRVIVPYTKAELQAMQDIDPWDNELDDLG